MPADCGGAINKSSESSAVLLEPALVPKFYPRTVPKLMARIGAENGDGGLILRTLRSQSRAQVLAACERKNALHSGVNRRLTFAPIPHDQNGSRCNGERRKADRLGYRREGPTG